MTTTIFFVFARFRHSSSRMMYILEHRCIQTGAVLIQFGNHYMDDDDDRENGGPDCMLSTIFNGYTSHTNIIAVYEKYRRCRDDGGEIGGNSVKANKQHSCTEYIAYRRQKSEGCIILLYICVHYTKANDYDKVVHKVKIFLGLIQNSDKQTTTTKKSPQRVLILLSTTHRHINSHACIHTNSPFHLSS